MVIPPQLLALLPGLLPGVLGGKPEKPDNTPLYIVGGGILLVFVIILTKK